MGLAYQKMNQLEEARMKFKQAVEINSKNYLALYFMGKMQERE